MQMSIQSRHFPLTQALSAYIHRRMNYAFSARFDQVTRIAIKLADINGPRGGQDKQCRLVVSLAGLPDVVVDEVQTDLYVAIDRAASRANRSITRKLNRTRNKVPREFGEPQTRGNYINKQHQAILGEVS